MSTDSAVDDPASVDAEPGIGPGLGPGTAPASDPAASAADAKDQIACAKPPPPAFLHSPPDSNEAAKSDASDSELSDLEDEPVLDGPPLAPEPSRVGHGDQQEQHDEHGQQLPPDDDDLGDVLPDHWSGAVPVFRPTMHQFKDFQRFMNKVDCYGMKSGIIKIIPPREWKDAQPPLDDLIKYVKVREPIKQDIMGSNGTYRQVNILHGRSYNLPQWRQLCEQSEHQPPARRGERRANAERPKPKSRPAAAPKAAKPSTPKKRGKGRPPKTRSRQAQNKEDEERPMTPVSPREEPRDAEDEPVDSIEKDAGDDVDDNDPKPAVGRTGGARQPKPKTQSVSARRKYSRREGSAMIDEAAFKEFDYRMDIAEYTPERCEELERAYWKTLTYAPPLYGADLMGTLFDDRTEIWNLNKLPNLLDVLGTKVPGVNTAYLYLGMWKATFAWHLEDVDLYSINYLHFGAPKQWYSISQADARRFEAAMKSVWPADAKACDQFLRHKGFLISPHHLLQHYGIKVNKVVSYPGEFVVTYPYGYHSGYNLGYNCAEAVNFALDSWLEMGKIAKRCECAQAQDSVWINVYEIERKLRGEETEYEETEVEEDEDEDGEGEMSGLPTPPASHGVRFKDAGRKRKRTLPGKREKVKVKKIKLRLKTKTEPPCCLCPHDVSGLDMLPTEDGRKAHRMCALYVPETYIDAVDGKEVVCNVGGIHKDRLDLKCLFCRSKRGACFQCSKKKCARAYHATCAAAAGVFVEEQDVPVFGEDGTEFKEQAFEFSCRFHRVRRDKKTDGDALEADAGIRAAAAALRPGQICQFQFLKGEIFAGTVVENCAGEEAVRIRVLPNGDRFEVEWKWLLLPDPSDFRLPKASAKALPLPASRKAKDLLNAKRLQDEKPRKDDVFADGLVWAEFHSEQVANTNQARVDLAKPDQVWHYLGKTSTDARAQYTEDPAQQRHNPRGNFLDTLPKPTKPAPVPRTTAHVQRPAGAAAGGYAHPHQPPQPGAPANIGVGRFDKPYVYKPRKPIEPHLAHLMYTPQRLAPATAHPHPPPAPSPVAVPPQQGGGGPTGFAYNGGNLRYPAQMEQPMAGYGPPPARPPPPAAPTSSFAMAPPTQRPLPPAQQKPSAAHQNRPTWQVHSSVYHKYPFFQVNHNRDSSKYRSPYAPWGGFANAHGGEVRAYLMSRQSDALRRPSSLSMPSAMHFGQHYGPPSRQAAVDVMRRPMPAPLPPAAAQAPAPAAPPQHQGHAMPPPPPRRVSLEAPGRPLQPAIKPRYMPVQQQHGQASQQGPSHAPKAKSGPAAKSYKVGLPAAVTLALKSTKPAVQIPPKQSPVPLPANFLAAMASSPSSIQGSNSGPLPPAAAGGPPPTLTAREPAKAAAPAPVRGPAGLAISPRPESMPVQGVRSSVTPVPVPVPAPRLSNPPPAQAPPPQTMMARPAAALPMTGSAMAAAMLAAPGPGPASAGPGPLQQQQQQQGHANGPPAGPLHGAVGQAQQQEFPDVPGCESMRFVERMMENLKRVSQRGATDGGGG